MPEAIQRKQEERTEIKFAEGCSAIFGSFASAANGLPFGDVSGKLDESYTLEHIIGSMKKKKYANKVMALLQGMYMSNSETFIHSINIALLCYELSSWLGMPLPEREVSALSGLLHDVGKLAVPTGILQKPGVLTTEERRIMEKHAVLGFKLLLHSGQDVDMHVCNAALMHHENCDGSGYPEGLSEKHIDKYAKIVAIADVYDAMTARRVYHQGMRSLDVIRYMEDNCGKFDKEYLSCFAENIRTFVGK